MTKLVFIVASVTALAASPVFAHPARLLTETAPHELRLIPAPIDLDNMYGGRSQLVGRDPDPNVLEETKRDYYLNDRM